MRDLKILTCRVLLYTVLRSFWSNFQIHESGTWNQNTLALTLCVLLVWIFPKWAFGRVLWKVLVEHCYRNTSIMTILDYILQKCKSCFLMGLILYLKKIKKKDQPIIYQAPIPLTIFWSNLKFDRNLQCSHLIYTPRIKTKFCTCHDSYTVVTCTKFCCDPSSTF